MESKFGQASLVDDTDIYIFAGADHCMKNQMSKHMNKEERVMLSNQKLNISKQ